MIQPLASLLLLETNFLCLFFLSSNLILILQDLVIPPMFSPRKYASSPFFGAPERPRDILAFFKGDVRKNDKRKVYSRGIRQNLTYYCERDNWWDKHRIWVGFDFPPVAPYNSSYSYALASSKFCFVLPGDGWSGRFEDSMMHGCIPVIIQDDVDISFESIMDVSLFTIRIAQADLERVPEILEAKTDVEVERMLEAVKKVWNRYWYGGYVPHKKAAAEIEEKWRKEREVQEQPQRHQRRRRKRQRALFEEKEPLLEDENGSSGNDKWNPIIDKVEMNTSTVEGRPPPPPPPAVQKEKLESGNHTLVSDHAFETIIAWLAAKIND